MCEIYSPIFYQKCFISSSPNESEIVTTDRVRSTKEGYVLTRVCPSICLSTRGGGHTAPGQGGTPARSNGGIPQPGPTGDIPQPGLMGGTPARSDGGYPRWGTPWPGLMGVPKVGYPPQGWVPLARSDGGTPPPLYRTTDGVLDMPVAVGMPAAVGMPLAFTQEDFLVYVLHLPVHRSTRSGLTNIKA